eukprot:2597125-Karenia_brevis.AAC.1
MAFDFAVTSGLRADTLATVTTEWDAHLQAYEDFKRSHLETEGQCLAEGIGFTPMVIDAVGGGWGKAARGVWTQLAKSMALSPGEESTVAVHALQRMSLLLHKENARAVLRRCRPQYE